MTNPNEQLRKLQQARASESEVDGEKPAEGGVSSLADVASVAGQAPSPEDSAAAHEKLSKEKQELYERLLRKQAELENLRKRAQQEKEEFLQHATADLIRALLPVLDGFERALKQRDPKVPEQFYKGVEMIYGEFLGVLGRAGVTPIPTEGKLFDPHLHQAVETVEAPGRRDQEIVEELQRGYKLKHRLLRPAIVKVALAKKKTEPAPSVPPVN